MKTKSIISVNKEIDFIKKEIEKIELEYTSILKERMDLNETLVEHIDYGYSGQKELTDEECLSRLYLEFYKKLTSSIEELINNTNHLDYKYINITCSCGFNFEQYNREIIEEIDDLPSFNYDLIIYFTGKNNNVLYFQPVHFFGDGDGGVYSMLACKKRKAKLEIVEASARIIKNIFQNNIEKDDIEINILGMDDFKKQIAYTELDL